MLLMCYSKIKKPFEEVPKRLVTRESGWLDYYVIQIWLGIKKQKPLSASRY
jgi:hypothetical protein